jgi:hypothetical protein
VTCGASYPDSDGGQGCNPLMKYGPLSKGVAQLLAVVGAAIGLTGIAFAIIFMGINDRSTPILLTVLATLGTIITALISAMKSTEAADTAAKANNTTLETKKVAELTASQSAMLQQVLLAHVDCPLPSCPMGLHQEKI